MPANGTCLQYIAVDAQNFCNCSPYCDSYSVFGSCNYVQSRLTLSIHSLIDWVSIKVVDCRICGRTHEGVELMNLQSFHWNVLHVLFWYPPSVRCSCIFYAIQPNIWLAEHAGMDRVSGEIWKHNSGTDV